MATANGQNVLTSNVAIPRRGAWDIDLELDAAEALSGQVTIDLFGVGWVGTVLSAGVEASRARAAVVGGAGGLATELEAKNYAPRSGVEASSVLADILRESGETLSSTADSSLLGKRMRSWQRAPGPAGKAISRLADSLGATWRILRDGTVWVGVDAYSTLTIDHVLLTDDNANGAVTVGHVPDGEATLLGLNPGVTFLGKRIEHVEFNLTAREFTATVRVTAPGSAFDKLLEGVRREIDYSRLYRARVVSQNSDGTLELLPSGGFKGKGVGRVPYLLGVPGTVEVSKGQEVLLGFEGGDPQFPVAIAWFKDDYSVLNLGHTTEFIAIAKLCDALFQAHHERLKTHTHSSGMGPTGPAIEGSTWPEPQSVQANKTKAE